MYSISQRGSIHDENRSNNPNYKKNLKQNPSEFTFNNVNVGGFNEKNEITNTNEENQEESLNNKELKEKDEKKSKIMDRIKRGRKMANLKDDSKKYQKSDDIQNKAKLLEQYFGAKKDEQS